MQFDELSDKAQEILDLYARQSENSGSQPWSRLDLVTGFVGDVGALVKYAMAKEGLREIDNIDEKLKHELADCLWSLLVISKKYEINLEAAFVDTMDSLSEKIMSQLNKHVGTSPHKPT